VTVQLRTHDPSCAIMYYIDIKAYRQHICILYVHYLPSSRQQVTHVWKPTTTLTNLTLEELKNSVTRAQEVNQLVTLRQAYDNLPQLGELIEPWLSEVNEILLPEATNSDPGNEVLQEILGERLEM